MSPMQVTTYGECRGCLYELESTRSDLEVLINQAKLLKMSSLYNMVNDSLWIKEK